MPNNCLWHSITATAVALGLSACATPYMPPEQGPFARVRVTSEFYDFSQRMSYMPPSIAVDEACTRGARLPLHHYSGSEKDTAAIAEFRSKAFSLGMPDAPKSIAGQKLGEIRVPAGRPVALFFHHGFTDGIGAMRTYNTCKVTGTFRFEPSMDYEVTFRTLGGPGQPGGCEVKAEQLFSLSGEVVRLPIPALPSCR